MANDKSDRSVNLVVNPITFLELENKAFETKVNLSDIYTTAIEEYLNDCNPGRLKVFAAPVSGKRIRVFLTRKLYLDLSKKIGTTGFNIKDILYTALECHLDESLRKIAA